MNDKKDVAGLRTFMSPAYILEVEKGLYEMYRDIEVEENGKREKFGKKVGPIMVLRRKQKGEQADFTTVDPRGDVIELKRIDARKPEIFDLLPPEK